MEQLNCVYTVKSSENESTCIEHSQKPFHTHQKLSYLFFPSWYNVAFGGWIYACAVFQNDRFLCASRLVKEKHRETFVLLAFVQC